MIDLTKVTKTKRGYKVLQTMYCPTNEESEQIVACIMTGFGQEEEESEAISYFADGSYLKDRESGMDLVEEETRIKQGSEGDKGIKQEVEDIKQCMLSIRDNISVLLMELDR